MKIAAQLLSTAPSTVIKTAASQDSGAEFQGIFTAAAAKGTSSSDARQTKGKLQTQDAKSATPESSKKSAASDRTLAAVPTLDVPAPQQPSDSLTQIAGSLIPTQEAPTQSSGLIPNDARSSAEPAEGTGSLLSSTASSSSLAQLPSVTSATQWAGQKTAAWVPSSIAAQQLPAPLLSPENKQLNSEEAPTQSSGLIPNDARSSAEPAEGTGSLLSSTASSSSLAQLPSVTSATQWAGQKTVAWVPSSIAAQQLPAPLLSPENKQLNSEEALPQSSGLIPKDARSSAEPAEGTGSLLSSTASSSSLAQLPSVTSATQWAGQKTAAWVPSSIAAQQLPAPLLSPENKRPDSDAALPDSEVGPSRLAVGQSLQSHGGDQSLTVKAVLASQGLPPVVTAVASHAQTAGATAVPAIAVETSTIASTDQDSYLPVAVAPEQAAPASTAPASTAPTSTAPASTAPASTAPASTAPASTAPASTITVAAIRSAATIAAVTSIPSTLVSSSVVSTKVSPAVTPTPVARTVTAPAQPFTTESFARPVPAAAAPVASAQPVLPYVTPKAVAADQTAGASKDTGTSNSNSPAAVDDSSRFVAQQAAAAVVQSVVATVSLPGLTFASASQAVPVDAASQAPIAGRVSDIAKEDASRQTTVTGKAKAVSGPSAAGNRFGDSTGTDAPTESASAATSAPILRPNASPNTGGQNTNDSKGFDMTSLQQVTQASPTGGADHTAQPSLGVSASAETAARTTPMPTALEAPPMQSVSSAQLTQTMQSSEMKLGMQSAEFGNISISTSLNHQALSAQISIDHSELGRALAVHLPAIEEKLGSAYGVQAKVELRDSSNPPPSNDSGYSNSGQQSREQRQSQGGGSTAYPGATYERIAARASFTPVSTTAAVSRLDIRI